MIEIKCKAENFKLVPIEQIVPNPKNNNRHSIEQINAIAKLIKAHGFREPLTISNRSGFLNCGHARLEAATNLGMTEVPVIYQDFASEAEEYQHMTADNEIARWAELDFQGVYDALKEIPDIDTSLLGIEDFKLPEIVEPQADEDDVPEARPEPKVVRGEVYILGNHRLMCGDSTAITDVERLMNGEKADMVFTDPPYGMSYESNAWDSKKSEVKEKRTDSMIMNDQTTEVGKDAIRLIPALIKDECHIYIWCRWDCFGEFLNVAREISTVKGVVVWDKGGPGLGDLKCSYGDSEWAIHCLNGRKPLAERQNGVWQVNRMKGLQMVHPTQKPVELCSRAITNSTKKFELVLDLFGGSGSTIIGAEETGRRANLMELDPKYCGVILDRWQKFTGKKAHREDGKSWDEIKEAN